MTRSPVAYTLTLLVSWTVLAVMVFIAVDNVPARIILAWGGGVGDVLALFSASHPRCCGAQGDPATGLCVRCLVDADVGHFMKSVAEDGEATLMTVDPLV